MSFRSGRPVAGRRGLALPAADPPQAHPVTARHLQCRLNPSRANPNDPEDQAQIRHGEALGAAVGKGGFSTRRASAVYLARVALIGVSLVSVSLLSLAELDAIGLPGCRVGSGCAAAASSVWGRIPVVAWPTAFVGTAWFFALAVWTLLTGPRPAVSKPISTLIAFGGLGSLLLLGASVFGGYLCAYCIVANSAHLLYVLLSFFALPPADSTGPVRPLRQRFSIFGAGAAAALATLGLAAVYVQTGRLARQRDAAALRESTAKVVQASTRVETAVAATQVPQAAAPVPLPSDVNSKPDSAPASGGFTGRWRLGPEVAQIRIVVLTDYQCPDCKALEAKLSQLVSTNQNVSLSVKHFPLCKDCNPKVGQTLHPNACWAARFTEAAGMLGGQEKFWQAHTLMFQRGGAFTDAEFPALISGLGLDPRLFSRTMQSQATLDLVKADIAEGFALGISQTPMMFINGVEIRGAHQAGALMLAVQAVVASGIPARTAAVDAPPNAFSKALADFDAAPVREIAPEFGRPAAGAVPEDAGVRVVVFGDVQDPLTCAAHAEVMKLVAADPRVRYEYRHFPLDRSCNPSLPEAVSRHPAGCMAARAIEAAGEIKGPQAQQRLFQWLVENRDRLSEQVLREGAQAMSLDDVELFAMMRDIRVTNSIAADLALAGRVGLRAVPSVWVNGKFVGTLTVDGNSVLAAVVQAELARRGK